MPVRQGSHYPVGGVEGQFVSFHAVVGQFSLATNHNGNFIVYLLLY
jgi:hypothetical protein